MLMVVDRADQSMFALPCFTYTVKDRIGDGLYVHLIGLLRHFKVNNLRLFTMTDEQGAGVNHIVEYIHRLLNECTDERPLPLIFYLQLDSY